MSSEKSLELTTSIETLHKKLNDTDFSNKIFQITNSDTGLIEGAQVNYNNLLTIVNSWYTMIKSCENLDKIIIFINDNTLQNAINSFNEIYTKFNQYNSNPNIQKIVESKSIIDNVKSYMIHLTPHIENKGSNKLIEGQWKFTKEKEQINKYLDDSKKIAADLQQKSKAINDFHQKLINENTDPSKEIGIRKYIEDSYDKIKQKYNELFVTNKQSKIKEQDVSAVGEIGMVDLFVKDAKSKQKEVEILAKEIAKQKVEIENLNSEFEKQLEGDEEEKIKSIKQTKADYETKMKSQQDEIDKMTVDTKKALGNHVEDLMVDTFKKEARWKTGESYLMMLCSLISLGLIGYLGYE